MIRAVKFALLAFAAVALAFSLDCLTPIADSQTMECCGSMPCNQGNQSHDCCKTMQQDFAVIVGPGSPSFHSFVLQPSAAGSHFSVAELARPVTSFDPLIHVIDTSPPGIPHETISVLRI
jgi:hypothetical protein